MKQIHLFHKWTSWSKPENREYTIYGGIFMGSKRGQRICNAIERWQIRECKDCKIIDERNLTDN